MTLTATGLTIPRLADLRQSLRDAVVSGMGTEWQVDEESVLGQLLDVFAAQLALSYSLAQQVYDGVSPDSAEGVQLDRLCALVGIVREPATYSAGTVQLTGTDGVTVPAGSLVRVPSGGPIFETIEDATFSGGAAEVDIQAGELGPVAASSSTITEIVTAISGWSSVTNSAAVTPGRNRETDAELRFRRERSLVAPSSSTDYGIASTLAELTSVDFARVVSDRSAHTLRAIVYPDTADVEEVAKALWDTCPAGIEQLGSQSRTVVDARGFEQVVKWDWVSEVTPAVAVDLEGPTSSSALTAQVKAAVLEEVALLGVGESVYAVQLEAAIVTAIGAQVTSCSVELDGASSLAVDIDEIVFLEEGDITVTVS